MVLSPPHPLQSNQTLNTLRYFDKYDYPLTYGELVFWQSRTGSHLVRVQGETLFEKQNGFHFLPGRSRLVKLRKQRVKFSQVKWQIARRVGEKLKKIPFIAAVFVTGALAMNNCPEDDDIDLMIITYPNTLWITRFFVNLYLHRTRRYPGQTTSPDRICPNLWLDVDHLTMNHEPTNYERNLYQAHEILQAKVLWDRAGVHYQFLKQNSWAGGYLPIAYDSQFLILNFKSISNFKFQILNLLFYPLNAIFFALQYLYMKPKMTTERVGLGYAFFHPRTKEAK